METKTSIDLKKFCSDGEGWNKSCNAPFSIGDFTYATNGHLAVRIPRLPDIGKVEGAPNAASLNWSAVETDKWIPIDVSKLETVECEECDGGEKYPHDCPDCHCECENCDEGVTFKHSSVEVGSKKANPRYLALIQSLPNALVAPEATAHTEAIPFKFDGGVGLLMPMRD